MTAAEKASLRRRMLAEVRAMPADEAAERSRRACEVVLGWDGFARAETMLLYRAMRGEVDTEPIALGAWSAGKRVLLPRVDDLGGGLDDLLDDGDVLGIRPVVGNDDLVPMPHLHEDLEQLR